MAASRFGLQPTWGTNLSEHMPRPKGETPKTPAELAGHPEDHPFSEPVVIPIGAELDLHTFSPREVEPLLADYLEACRAKGLTLVKIIHGKGTGQLKDRVRRVLAKNPLVEHLADADPESGGWGATRVWLKKPDPDPASPNRKPKTRNQKP